jgi:hypothetical protein
VDLLLDRTVRAAGNGSGHSLYTSGGPVEGDRVVGAQRLLQLLELMPNVEPPPDLVTRTLRLIDRDSRHPAVMQSQMPQSLIDMHRQHA